MKKILVGDDSSAIVNLCKKVLVQKRYEIKGLKNGLSVQEAIEKENYDLIILDIFMPGATGFEIIEALRRHADPIKSSTPVIAITGNAKGYPMQKFLDAGFQKVLIKPLDYDLLVATVNEVLAANQMS